MKLTHQFIWGIYCFCLFIFLGCGNDDAYKKNRRVHYSIDYGHSGEGGSSTMNGETFSAVDIVERITTSIGFEALRFVIPEGTLVVTGLPKTGGSQIVYTKKGSTKEFSKSIATKEELVKILEDAFYLKELEFQQKYNFE